MTHPDIGDLEEARTRVYAHLSATPLVRYPLVDEWLGCAASIKHENHQATGSFKVRGGLNLVAQLDDEERRCGVVSASTGNHGQSMAYACRLHRVPCRIVVPVGNNPDKTASMRALGATVVEQGRDFDEAREHVEAVAPREGWRYVHSANEPQLIAGVGTYALEIFDQLPDADYIFVPIGGGSGAAGCCLARTGRNARAKIIGVQAAGAPAFARSWKGPMRVTTAEASTFAEGIATRTTYDLTFEILKRGLDDVVILEEDEIREGIRAALQLTHNLAEGAGAASLAAAYKLRAKVKGNVVCVMTGANIDIATLRRIVNE
jgi:threonine dehydratase